MVGKQATEEELEGSLLIPVEKGDILNQDQPGFEGLIPMLAAMFVGC